MLRNPLYRGESIYNRSEWVKDHETGRRRRFERPEADWVRRTDESWRIVSDETWRAVQERMGRKALGGRERVALPMRRGPEKYALSGLLRCGTCGGSFCCVTGRELVGCSWHRDRGSSVCASALRVPRRALEARVFGGLRELLSRDRVERVVALAIEELRRDEGRDLAGPLRARLVAVERELGNVVDLAATHGASDTVRRKLDQLEAERAGLDSELKHAPAPPTDWSALRSQAETLLGDLPGLVEAAGAAEARAALREYLGGERLSVFPDSEGGYRVEGELVLPPERKEPREIPRDLARLIRW